MPARTFTPGADRRARAAWSRAGVAVAAALVLAACGGSDDSAGGAGQDNGVQVVPAAAKVAIPEQLAALTLADRKQLAGDGAGQTLIRDPRSGAIHMAWMRRVPGVTPPAGEDPAQQIVVATSTDNGAGWGEPVVVSTAEQKAFYTATANPAVTAIGPDGQLYVAYTAVSDSDYSDFGASRSWFTRSEDGGKTFSAPVQIVTDEKEGLEAGIGTSYMNGLYVAKDGDVFYTFLDEREVFEAKKKELAAGSTPHAGHGAAETEKPATHLRVSRSADQGRTWSVSTLVGKPMCGCCGTIMTENGAGELFAGTRSAFEEHKGSYDAVRDIVLSKSTDDGATWGEPVKVHDDGFKVSGCPDISAGLATDSKGVMHAAWYTGTEAHPGVFYAKSTDGQTWSKPLALLHGKWAPYADVRLVLDGQDQPWVAFEDRTGDVETVRVARVDPEAMKVAFAEAVPGRGPALAVGDGWALLTFESSPASENDEGPFALNSVLTRVAAT